MKTKILFIGFFILTLTSCDPIYVAELRNNSGTDIEINVCGQNLDYVNFNLSAKQIVDTTLNCKTFVLSNNDTMDIARASGIAKPIVYQDLGFNQIRITTSSGQIIVSGKEIMNLFTIEQKRNFIGLHTYDLYVINVEQAEKNNLP